MTQRITALVGAQYGSEGKGAVAAKIAHRYGVHVRTGAPNAGHTYYDRNGQKTVARAIPCAAGINNAVLIVGAGAVVDVEALIDEALGLEHAGHRIAGRLFVDEQAVVITRAQHEGEGGVDGRAHSLIGSTGEGVGLARMAKINRGSLVDAPWAAQVNFADEWRDALDRVGAVVLDTAHLLNTLIDDGASVLLEGTQGSGLSLTHGPWPFVTSTDTNAAQLAADAGIAPHLVTDTILVARTFPIRVAGNSGPMRGEISFEDLGVEPERTTVTRKVRRVGAFDPDLFRRAVMLNRPSSVAVTFLDYVVPNVAGVEERDKLPAQAWQYIWDFENDFGVPVSLVGTGPRTMVEVGTTSRVDESRFLNSDHGERQTRPWPTRSQTWPRAEEVVA